MLDWLAYGDLVQWFLAKAKPHAHVRVETEPALGFGSAEVGLAWAFLLIPNQSYVVKRAKRCDKHDIFMRVWIKRLMSILNCANADIT